MTHLCPALLRDAHLRYGKNLGLLDIVHERRTGHHFVMEKAVVNGDESNRAREDVEEWTVKAWKQQLECVEERTIRAEQQLMLKTEQMHLLELFTGCHVDDILGFVVSRADVQDRAHRRVRLDTSLGLADGFGCDFGNGLDMEADNTDASDSCESLEAIKDIRIRFGALKKRTLSVKDESERVSEHLAGIEESMDDMIKVWSSDLDIAEDLIDDLEESVCDCGARTSF